MNKDMLKALLSEGQEWQALKYLEQQSPDESVVYMLSHLYRFFHRFDDEKELLDRAQKNAYVVERLNWLERPIFHHDATQSRVIPRKPLRLERDPSMIPQQETLDNLCIVTGAGSDSPYRELAIELLESIENTRYYKDIPVCMFDLGLTDDDKHFFMTRFKNLKEIKDPGWDIHPPYYSDSYWKENNKEEEKKEFSKIPLGYKMITATPFMNKHFPQFKYYLRMDTDTWVQDERVLDQVVSLCEKQDISSIQTPGPVGSYWDPVPIDSHILNLCKSQNFVVSTSFFCIKHIDDLFSIYKKTFNETTAKYGFMPIQDDAIVTYLFFTKGNSTNIESWFMFRGETPLYDHNDMLFKPSHKNIPIGIIESVGPKTYTMPYMKKNVELSQEQIQAASNIYQSYYWRLRENKNVPFPELPSFMKPGSSRFRKYPDVNLLEV